MKDPKKANLIPLRRLSKLPESLRSPEATYIKAPDILESDSTAFAFHPPANSVFFGADSSVFYASNRRDPVKNDTVIIDLKNGESVVRSIWRIEKEEYIVLNLKNNISNEISGISFQEERIKFEDILRISVVILTTMF